MKKALLSITLFTLLLLFFDGCPIKEKKSTKDLFIIEQSTVNNDLNAVSFISPAKGVTVGASGIILLTNNGGYNWDSAISIDSRNLYGVVMINNSLIVAVGDSGKIVRTTNGGTNWSLVPNSNIQFLQTLRCVAFYSENDGYAVGDSGAVLYTSDAGLTWTKRNSPDANQILYGISYNSSFTPFAVGSDGNVYKAIGDNWVKDTTIGSNDLYSIQFVSTGGPFSYSDTGYAVGASGTIIKTSDGGNSWDNVSSPTTNDLHSVFLTNYHWGYAVGDGATVLRYDGRSWKMLPLPQVNGARLNGVDPSWTPTSTCVGADGKIVRINPPAVNDANPPDYPDPSSITTESSGSCEWGFTLDAASMQEPDPESETPFSYETLEVCSSVEQVVIPGGPLAGWVQNDRFFSKSQDIGAGEHWAPDDPNHRLAPLTLNVSSLSSVSGYITCYYLDQYNNPHLLISYEIVCP